MSGRDLRRRAPANRRAVSKSRTLRPSPSPANVDRQRIAPVDGRKAWKLSEKVMVLKRSNSEPSLWKPGGGAAAAAVAAVEEEEDEGVLYRPLTCIDIFESPETRSPRNSSEGYNKDAKVVVNVTVEGSPGPIKAMVKLGSNVEDTIKQVVKKYNDEGRTPYLDKNAASTCELHHTYFCLQSLSKSEIIGDVGSRSFYLRKHISISHRSDVSTTDNISTSSNQPGTTLPLSFLPSFIAREINKIFRRSNKFWKLFGCITCT